MATYSDNQIVLEIDIKYDEAVRNINNYREKIRELMEMQTEYQDKVKAHKAISDEEAMAYERRETQIRNLKTEMRQFQKELDNNFKQERDIQQKREGSLVSLRAQLSNVTREYDELSRAERDAAKGKGADLKAKINAITNELKEAEEATTRYYRNVGNYENSIQSALGANSKWFQSLNMIQDITAGGLKNGLTIATQAVSTFGKQLLALLANPIVAILAAIAAVFKLVSDAIKNNEENTDKLRKIMAPFGRVIELVSNLLQKMAGVILSVVENGGKMLAWVMKALERIPLLGNAIRDFNNELADSIQLEQEAQNIRNDRRKEEVAQAKASLESQRLLTKAYDKVNYSAKQRLEFVRQATKIEQERADQAEKLAARELKLAQQRASISKNDSKTNDELAQKEAAYYQAQQQREALQTSLKQRESRLIREIKGETDKAASAEKARASAAESSSKDVIARKKEELAAVRSAEDAMTRIIRDNNERRRKEIDYQFSRQIEDLELQLEEANKSLKEKGDRALTEKARKAIQDEIDAVRQEWQIELEKFNDEVTANAIELEQKRFGYLLEAAKENVLKRRELQIAQLDDEQKLEEQRITREITNEQKREEVLEALRSAYNAKRKAVEAQFDQDIENERKQRIENEFAQLIEQAGNNELEALRLQAEQRLQILEGARQLEGESLEQFNARKLQMQKDYNDALKAVADKEVAIEEAKYRAIGTAAKSMSDLLAELGENEKSAAIASKVLALAEIAINSGVAIAKGIKESQSVPFPANIAAIATTVATILSGITSAIKTVKSAKFAQGGTVFGVGTGTSDSINARLSNGESVMTSQATSLFSPILSAMNQLGGGVPIIAQTPQTQLGEDMIAAAVAKGMQMAPRPVVSVEEINNVQQRVEVIENIAKL